MNKGFIIGMTGLALGSVIAGGVGGYYIGNAINNKQSENTEVAEEASNYTEYDLPEEFGYLSSYNLYDAGNNYYVLSSSSVGTYLCNKNTGEYKFLNSSYISSCSDIINNNIYLYFSDYSLYSLNVLTGAIVSFDLNLEFSYSSLYFIGQSDDCCNLYLVVYSSSYYFINYNIDKKESVSYTLTNSGLFSSCNVIDTDNYYIFYSNSTAYNSTFFINKTSGVFTSVSHGLRFLNNAYFIKDDVLYGFFATSTSSSSCYFGCIDFETLTYTTLFSSALYSYQYLYGYDTGVLFLNNLGSSAYFYSFEDGAVTTLTYSGVSVQAIAIINDVPLFSYYASSASDSIFSCLLTFNSETASFDVVFTEPLGSSTSHILAIYNFNDNYYIHTGVSSYARWIKFDIDENGAFVFTQISLLNLGSLSSTNYDLGDDRYIFVSEGLHYYDFENDIYKKLTSSYTINDYAFDEENEDIVYLYLSNNYKYELNLNTLSFKVVAYYE